MSISAITAASPGVFTSTNHNLQSGDWIILSGITGTTSTDGVSLNGRNFKVNDASLSASTFTLSEFPAINGGLAIGTSYTYTVSYKNLITGSAQINIGSLVFTDPAFNGILVEAASLGSGTINYSTGVISLTFNPAILSNTVWIRVVSYDPLQQLARLNTTGVYVPGGEIAIISNIDVQSKFFNFFKADQKARINKIDFYVNSTTNGQFTCNLWGDSSNDPINTPLADNPLQNVVLTSREPYQIGLGDQTIYRLYCDSVASTIQLQFTMQDQQMAVSGINQSDIEIAALMVSARPAGRVI